MAMMLPVPPDLVLRTQSRPRTSRWMKDCGRYQQGSVQPEYSWILLRMMRGPVVAMTMPLS